MSDAPDIEHAIRAMVEARAPATICPSEVARALADDWRPLMGSVREIATAMPDIEATQKGMPVDPITARGPIRLRLKAP